MKRNSYISVTSYIHSALIPYFDPTHGQQKESAGLCFRYVPKDGRPKWDHSVRVDDSDRCGAQFRVASDSKLAQRLC